MKRTIPQEEMRKIRDLALVKYPITMMSSDHKNPHTGEYLSYDMFEAEREGYIEGRKDQWLEFHSK